MYWYYGSALFRTCLCAAVDPAFAGLSLAYAATISGILQYAVRLSAEVEDLVRFLAAQLILHAE